MHDLDFERRLRESAPPVSTPLGIAEHSDRILREARIRHGRKLRVMVGSVAASVVLVGGGTVAVGSNGMETPWGWSADNVHEFPGPDGQTCFAGFRVDPDGVPGDAEVVLVARDIVAGLDLDTLDTSEATADLEASNDRPFDDGSPGAMHLTPEEIAQSAMTQAVADTLFAELDARGFSTPDNGAPVSLFSQAQGCQ